MITGTDSPISPNAVSTHLNLRAMVAYGMTPYDALSTATRIPGEFLEEPIGRIVPGHYADLVVLGGDPLTDIDQAANVRQVIAAGVCYTVPELLEPFVTAAPAIAASPILAAPAAHPSNDRYWWHDARWVEEGRHACCDG